MVGKEGEGQTIRVQGWQSWSLARDTFLRVPCHRFSPHGENSLEIQVPMPEGEKELPPRGWSSWPCCGPEVDERTVLTNARWISGWLEREAGETDRPLYIVIDDGWTRWGDWHFWNESRFPRGIEYVADKIKGLGLNPGIWLSPFLAEKRSRLFQNHPDWFVRNDRGQLLDGIRDLPGNLKIRKRYLLDFTREDVYTYIFGSIDTVLGWGFDLVKLDFLFAPYFHPQFKTSEKPRQFLQGVFTHIRENFPAAYILASGCPLEAAVGQVDGRRLIDGIRISEDVVSPFLAGRWPLNRLVHQMLIRHLEVNLAARKAIRTLWDLDPDIFACDPRLGISAIYLDRLAKTIKEAGGLIFLGDDLPNLPPDLTERYLETLLLNS
ncbi:MAG: alpha-galactosidase [Candidatus Pacebacteria bacterium]|nr:alpha-galactosidase [Candidatus Paceibacterota bacterium]